MAHRSLTGATDWLSYHAERAWLKSSQLRWQHTLVPVQDTQLELRNATVVQLGRVLYRQDKSCYRESTMGELSSYSLWEMANTQPNMRTDLLCACMDMVHSK